MIIPLLQQNHKRLVEREVIPEVQKPSFSESREWDHLSLHWGLQFLFRILRILRVEGMTIKEMNQISTYNLFTSLLVTLSISIILQNAWIVIHPAFVKMRSIMWTQNRNFSFEISLLNYSKKHSKKPWQIYHIVKISMIWPDHKNHY